QTSAKHQRGDRHETSHALLESENGNPSYLVAERCTLRGAPTSRRKTLTVEAPQPTASAGDRIVVRLADGQCNIDKITAASERVVDRTYITINQAWEIAHTGAAADGGRVWI